MPDMAVYHEVVVAADTSGPRVSGAAMNGHALAEDVVVANFQPRRFSLVLQMLRPFAQNRTREHFIALSHDQGAAQMSMRTNDATAADLNLPLQYGIGTDLNSFGDLDFGR